MTPEYINKHWTEELLALMFRSRMRRTKRMRKMAGEEDEPDHFEQVSEEEMWKRMSHHAPPEVITRATTNR